MSFSSQMDQLLLENQKAFDQAILTLSSALVAALLAFTQAKVKEGNATLFYFSTIPYAVAIASTLLTFLLAQTLVQQKRKNAYAYYIERIEASVHKRFCLETIIKFLHWFSAFAFLLSTIMAISFVAQSLNI